MSEMHSGFSVRIIALLAIMGADLGFAAVPETGIESPPVKTKDLTHFLLSSTFDPVEFNRLWSEYHKRQESKPSSQVQELQRKRDLILEAAVASNNPLALETVLGLSIAGVGPVFDPNRAFFLVASTHEVGDDAVSKIARVLIEYGGSPMKTGVTEDAEFVDMTPVEIAILKRKPKVLQAFLADPSPVSYESLEQLSNYGPQIRRGVELFRTAIVRMMHPLREESRLHKVNLGQSAGDESLDKMHQVLVEENFFVFASRYIDMLLMFLVYLVVIALVIIFIYHLRIKQVPHPETLMKPREEASFSSFIYVSASIVFTASPGSTLLEMLAYGIGLGGSVAWSLIWTRREDVALALFLAVFVQTVITETFYLSFAPKLSSETELADLQARPVHKLMFYPRGSDWNRAVLVTGNYLVSCALSMLILYSTLKPIERMYSCPTISISDTYGFPYSLTRTVAFTWDIIIFFMMSIRVYRVIDTFAVFNMSKIVGEYFNPPPSNEDEMVRIKHQEDKEASVN